MTQDDGFLSEVGSLRYGPLELLVIQASPFCNINCSYCYLPNRNSKKSISIETIEVLFRKLFESDIVQQDFTVTWHAGEPLTVSKDFYRRAIGVANSFNNTSFNIRNNVQTNGTLISQAWCDFFKEFDIRVSVSIDGPEHLHNKHRISRKGHGTFEETMAGIELLNKNQIEYTVISVVSDYSLDYAEEYYNFFKKIKPVSVGINIEEVENFNTSSSIFTSSKGMDRYKFFVEKLFDLYYSDDDLAYTFREFSQLERFIFTKNRFLNGVGQQTIPYRILSVDVEGNFSTFSPELLDAKSRDYGDFTFGNLHDAGSILDSLKSNKFRQIYGDIIKGVKMCKTDCAYFPVCGGGTPSNKYSENGTFISTETHHCRLRFQSFFDIFLSRLEHEFLIRNP